MAFKRPVIKISKKGIGYINKMAANQHNLYAGTHIQIFINQDREAILVVGITGFSICSVPAGLKFHAKSLITELGITQDMIYSIAAVIDSTVLLPKDYSVRVCKVCQEEKPKRCFRETTPGNHMWVCEQCRKKQERERHIKKKLCQN